MLILGVDTCGPSGSVALARVEAGEVEVLGQTELVGKTYSATLVSAVEGLLAGHGVRLKDVDAIAVVHGPGSFTGVRVGLSAVKGLAESGQIPVVAVSRLTVLAAKAGVGSAALDAHRQEVFLRVEADGETGELLAGAEELAHISKAIGGPGVVAVCDEEAAGLVSAAWSGVEILRSEPPTAADAIGVCTAELLGGRFANVATLDGHYLRRSDAEIFGDSGKARNSKTAVFRVRPMEAADIESVMEIVATTDHAPQWGRAAYVAALDPGNQPRRVAVVAEEETGLAGFVVVALLPGGEAELESIVTALPHQRRGVARELFAVLKAELRRQGIREVMLEVREGNHSAQGFYRFLGFREEGRRPAYYSEPAEDAVLMRLTLG